MKRLGLLLILLLSGAGCTSQTIYPMAMVHPVDAWWQYYPEESANWDYYQPVAQEQQPVPVFYKKKAMFVTTQRLPPATLTVPMTVPAPPAVQTVVAPTPSMP